MRVSIYSLHIPCVFGGRQGFDVDTSHVFPQGVFSGGRWFMILLYVYIREGDNRG